MIPFLPPSQFQIPVSHYFNSYDNLDNIPSKQEKQNLSTIKEQGLAALIQSNIYQINPLYGYALRHKANQLGNLSKIRSEYLDFFQQYVKQLTKVFEDNSPDTKKLMKYEITNLIEVLF